MLAMADGDLDLRNEIPVRLRSRHKVAVGDELQHRRPQPSQPVIRAKALANGRIKKQRLRRDAGVERQLRPKLCLDKSVALEKLIEGGEGFECGGARSEAARPVSAGNEKSAK